jgi:NitT/TauT family transport system substrate-binding protein
MIFRTSLHAASAARPRSQSGLSRATSLAVLQAFALVALSLLTRVAHATEEKLTLQLEWVTSGYHAPFYLSAAKDWYKDAGLDVAITPGTGSATTVQLVASGQSDVGHASLSSMAFARGKGVPVIGIANFFRTGDICLFVPNDSPVKTVADLKGKKLIATSTSFEAPFIDSFLAAGGLTRRDVTLDNVDFATRTGLYGRGDADGLFGSPVGTGVQLEKVRRSRCLLFGDYGLNVPSFGIFATPTMLAKKGAQLRALASIVAGAWTYIIASPAHAEEAVDALQNARAKDRLDRADMLKQLQGSFKFLHSSRTKGLPIGVAHESDWADAIATMEKAQVIRPGTKAADYFTNDYLDVDLIKKLGGS